MANALSNNEMVQQLQNAMQLLFYGPPAEREAYEADPDGWYEAHDVDITQYDAEDLHQVAQGVVSSHTESSAVDQAIDASITINQPSAGPSPASSALGAGGGGSGGGHSAPQAPVLPPPRADAPPDQIFNDYVTYVTENVTNISQDYTTIDSSQNPTIVLGEDSHLDSLTMNNSTITASGDGAVAGEHIGQANTGDGGVAVGQADNINTGERGIAADEVAGVASGDGAAAVGGDANAPIITGEVTDSTIIGGNMEDSTIGDNNVDADGGSTVVQGSGNMVAQDGATQTSVEGDANTLADRGSLVQQGGGNVVNSQLDNSAVAGNDALNVSGNTDANLGFGAGAVTEQHVAEGGAASVAGDATGSNDDVSVANSSDVAIAGNDAFVERYEDNDGFDIDDQDGIDIDDNDGLDIDDQDGIDIDDNDGVDLDAQGHDPVGDILES